MSRGQQQEECKSVRIAEDDLKACVLSELRAHITAKQKIDVEDVSTIQEQITALEQRIEKQWSAKKTPLYGGLTASFPKLNTRISALRNSGKFKGFAER